MSYSDRRYILAKEPTRKRKSTITRTFRIEKELDGALQEEAERRDTTVNFLVNQILRKFDNFDIIADRSGALSFTPLAVKGVIEAISDESLAKAGEKSGPLDIMDLLDMMGRPLDYNSIVFLLSEYFGGSVCSRWFTCFHHTRGSKDLFHLQHNLGRGWSIYLERYILSALKSLLKIDATAKVYDFAVNIEINRV